MQTIAILNFDYLIMCLKCRDGTANSVDTDQTAWFEPVLNIFTHACQSDADDLVYYEGPAKSFVTGFGLLLCYVLSNIFLLQTFKVFPLYWNTFL